MHKFYFNECLSGKVSEKEFASLFLKAIMEYESLINKDIGIERAIITEKLLSKIFINEISLVKVIESIDNRTIRTLAIKYLSKYPIGNSFYVDADRLLSEKFTFNELDALNLAIVAMNNGLLFSVATDDLLKKDKLELYGVENKLNVLNLYGDAPNTDYIANYLRKENILKLDSYNQLKDELMHSVVSSNFEKEFLSERKEVQQSIIDAFKEARQRKLPTPYYPDADLIKDVTPNTNRRAKVYELRLYYPKALRVYFYESTETVYVAKIGYKADYKADGNTQTKEINTIHQRLHAMALTK
jgi:hypothetical protein